LNKKIPVIKINKPNLSWDYHEAITERYCLLKMIWGIDENHINNMRIGFEKLFNSG